MPGTFRPKMELLEGREVPASFSLVLSNGTALSGQFSTPAGIDPEAESQTLTLPDLTLRVGASTFSGSDFTNTPIADYSFGGLVDLSFVVTDPSAAGYELIAVADSQADISQTGGEPEHVPVVADAADTQADFTLPDGTVGALSYDIPWDAVDPEEASQSLALTSFNLNLAGVNLSESNNDVDFTTTPTVEFEYGEMTGVTFDIDTSALANFPYTSVSMSGLTVSAQPIVGNAINATAAARQTALVIDFSTYVSPPNNAHSLSVEFTLADNTTGLVGHLPRP